MAKTIVGLVASFLLALSACTSADSMNRQVRYTGVAYDTVKDPSTPNAYLSRSAYDDDHESQSEQIKTQTLLNGVQALQKDGYDHVAWWGPLPATLVRTTTTSSGAMIGAKVYRGVDFQVQGWKSADRNVPSTARPISTALAELNGQVEQARSASAAAGSAAKASPASHMDWPVKGGSVTHFGKPNDPKSAYGILIRANDGTIVRAADSGVADIVGPTTVSIVHAGGYRTHYSCINPVLVKQGATVAAGQPIARIGAGGTCPNVPDSGLQFIVFGKRQALDPVSLLPPQ